MKTHVVSAQEWEAARAAAAREGEGHDPRPRRAGRRASADAVDGVEKTYEFEGPEGKASLATCSKAAVS